MMTQSKLEQLLEIFKQKHNQGDSYYCRFNNKGDKCIIGYKNDYPMQHGDGIEWQMPIEVADMLVSQMQLPVKPEIAKIVRDILQEGANIAMYGNPFESEEGVIKEQERLYDKAIKDYTTLLQKQFSV